MLNQYVVKWSLEKCALYVYNFADYAKWLKSPKVGLKAIYVKNELGWWDENFKPLFNEKAENYEQNVDLFEKNIYCNYQYIAFDGLYAPLFWLDKKDKKAKFPLLLALVLHQNEMMLSDEDLSILDSVVFYNFSEVWQKLNTKKPKYSLFKYELSVL